MTLSSFVWALSFLYTVKFSGEKYSEELTEGSNHVPVPIIMSGWMLSIRKSNSGFLFLIERKLILIIFNGRLLLNCVGLLSGFVFVVVWSIDGTGLWIGEDAAFGAPGLVISSSGHDKEENELCEIKEHDVSLMYELDKFGSPHLRQCQDK